MIARSRTTTVAAVLVFLAASPELVVGGLLILTGLPFAVGLGVLAGPMTPTQSVVFGLTMVVPGLAVVAAGLMGAVGAIGLFGCRPWALRASVAYALLVAAVGLGLIIFGDRSTGLVGSAVLAVGTILLSTLPLPSIREDLIARASSHRDGVTEQRGAL